MDENRLLAHNIGLFLSQLLGGCPGICRNVSPRLNPEAEPDFC